MTGMKFKNGKFVQRSEEEVRRLEAYFTETAKPKRIAKCNEPFIRVTLKQLDKLIPCLQRSPEVSVFFVLCHQSFRHRGAAFVWPSEQLQRIGGLSPRAQRRTIKILEDRGLISVERRHRKPPIVQVLTAT